MKDKELRYIRKHHKDLWKKLLDMEREKNLVGNMWNILNKIKINDKEEQFIKEEQRRLKVVRYCESLGKT